MYTVVFVKDRLGKTSENRHVFMILYIFYLLGEPAFPFCGLTDGPRAGIASLPYIFPMIFPR